MFEWVSLLFTHKLKVIYTSKIKPEKLSPFNSRRDKKKHTQKRRKKLFPPKYLNKGSIKIDLSFPDRPFNISFCMFLLQKCVFFYNMRRNILQHSFSLKIWVFFFKSLKKKKAHLHVSSHFTIVGQESAKQIIFSSMV